MQISTLDWAIRNLIAELLMPPGIWIVLALFAWLFFRKNSLWQKGITFFALLMVWVTSTPIFSNALMHIANPLMNWPEPLQLQDLKKATATPGAIVILGGGRRRGAIESAQYNFQDLSKQTLERIRYGAQLANQTGLPVLVSGGQPDSISDGDQAEALVMGSVLDQEFGVKVTWVEEQSTTTQENALNSVRVLKAHGIKHIYLVTHFWHMPRAVKIFEQYGLTVTPAPHGYESSPHSQLLDFYPQQLSKTREIWHEILGMIWYSIRY